MSSTATGFNSDMDGRLLIIGDVHGCFDTLIALIAKLPTDAKIIFVGDLIDRGPKIGESDVI